MFRRFRRALAAACSTREDDDADTIVVVDWHTGRVLRIPGIWPWTERPAVIQAVAGLVLTLAIAAGVQTWRLAELQADVEAERAAQVETALLRERAARAAQAEVDQRTRRATDAYLARAQAARDDAAGTDAAYRSLLDAIAAGGGSADDPAAACRAAAERVGILEGLLAEGAGLAAEGADRVGRLDAKLSGLQAFLEPEAVPVK